MTESRTNEGGPGDRPSVEDTFRSVNGFDDIAIEAAFGKELTELSAVRTTRALVFVIKRREGMSDHDAFLHVMKLGMGELDDQFSDESAEAAAGGNILADLNGDGPGKAPIADGTKPGRISS